MAVTGLPTPRKQHALAMCKFAHEAMTKSSQVFNALASTLGPETRNLNMRFGLHSGPVTAGVLRGEKGRFQLFGDTVNTAARMESNGAPGRIHLSESTAKILKSSGKKGWIKQREDKIVAKGKGEMTTFWLNLKSGRDVMSATSGTSRVSSTSGHSRHSAGSSNLYPMSTPFEDVTDTHASNDQTYRHEDTSYSRPSQLHESFA